MGSGRQRVPIWAPARPREVVGWQRCHRHGGDMATRHLYRLRIRQRPVAMRVSVQQQAHGRMRPSPAHPRLNADLGLRQHVPGSTVTAAVFSCIWHVPGSTTSFGR